MIGVTGLPACGKSTVTGMLGRLGAETLDADRLVHAALESRAVARRVADLLGIAPPRPPSRLDRAAVAAVVFRRGNDRLRRRLEGLLHPLVRADLRSGVAAARRRRVPAVVLEVPLLFEGRGDRMCDFTVFVDAPLRVRAARARRRGWTGADLRAREARFLPAAERRRRADFTVDNGGTRAATRRQVRELWKRTVTDRRSR